MKIRKGEKNETVEMGILGTMFIVCRAFLCHSICIGQTKLNYSVFFPAPHKNAVLATEWAKEIEKRTGGKVQITVFPGGTLTPADKCYDGVVKGISDIGFSVLAYTRGKFPLTEVSDLPLGTKLGWSLPK